MYNVSTRSEINLQRTIAIFFHRLVCCVLKLIKPYMSTLNEFILNFKLNLDYLKENAAPASPSEIYNIQKIYGGN